MARLTKQQQDLKTAESFLAIFEQVDRALKILSVVILGVSLLSYLSILIAGFIHTVFAVHLFELGWQGFFATLFLSIGFVGTELSAVYGAVYEEFQTNKTASKTAKEETKKFWEKLGIGSFIEFSMYFMAFITGFANLIYSLGVWKQLKAKNELASIITLKDLIGFDIFPSMPIDPLHLMAIILFSTIIPIVMIIQSKMQIQFLRFIMKTLQQIRAMRTRAENDANEENEKRLNDQLIKAKIKNVKKSNTTIESSFLAESISDSIAEAEEKVYTAYTETKEELELPQEIEEEIESIKQEQAQVKEPEQAPVEIPAIKEMPVEKRTPAKKKSRSRKQKVKQVVKLEQKQEQPKKSPRIIREPFQDDMQTLVDETGMGGTFEVPE